LTLNYKFQN